MMLPFDVLAYGGLAAILILLMIFALGNAVDLCLMQGIEKNSIKLLTKIEL